MMRMVASRRGVAALPRWLAEKYAEKMEIVPLRQGEGGIAKQIHPGLRETDLHVDYFEAFIELARSGVREPP